MAECYCGSGLAYAACCERVHQDMRAAGTAEALMRARYSAYVIGDIDFLGRSLQPSNRDDWDREATAAWSRRARWVGLEVLSVEAGGEEDETGEVEFIARWEESGQVLEHHECSQFRRFEEGWCYVDGVELHPRIEQVSVRKVGRNAPCPCGSGKKFKKCCGG